MIRIHWTSSEFHNLGRFEAGADATADCRRRPTGCHPTATAGRGRLRKPSSTAGCRGATAGRGRSKKAPSTEWDAGDDGQALQARPTIMEGHALSGQQFGTKPRWVGEWNPPYGGRARLSAPIHTDGDQPVRGDSLTFPGGRGAYPPPQAPRYQIEGRYRDCLMSGRAAPTYPLKGTPATWGERQARLYFFSNAAWKATALGGKSRCLTNSQASCAPCSRSMPLSSHSTESGPS